MKDMEDKRKTIQSTESITFICFCALTVVMLFFHDLNHEESQLYLLAKDSGITDLVFVLPHYMDVSPAYMLILFILSKTGLPATIALHLVSAPFSFASAYLIIFKAPFHKLVRFFLPFTFFLFYEYTVISSPYAILIFAFILLAIVFPKRNEKHVVYTLFLALLGACGLYGILFSLCFTIIWLVENTAFFQASGGSGKKYKSVKKGLIICPILLVLFGMLFIFVSIPNTDSFSRLLTDHKHWFRNLIYTLFIMPSDAIFSDVDFVGLLQNESSKFVNFRPLSLCAYFSSAAIVFVSYLITYINKKSRYFLFPYFVFAIVAAVGNLYNYQIGIFVPFQVFLMWICYKREDTMENSKSTKRSIPGWIDAINVAHKNIVYKGGLVVLVSCMSMSLVWTIFSCFSDIRFDVWYAKQLNDVIDKYHLGEYQIVSDWYYRPIINGRVYVQADAQMMEQIAMSTEIAEGKKRETEEGYVLTYLVHQLHPENYYQAPGQLNFSDCIAYNTDGINYISNLNGGKNIKRYNDYSYPTYEQGMQESFEFGVNGYPEIIIGDPNIVGLMNLNADDVRYYLIYEIHIRRTYKLYSEYQSWQMYIRNDLYESRTYWPFLDQGHH